MLTEYFIRSIEGRVRKRKSLMGISNKVLERSSRIKLSLGLLLCTMLSYASSGHCKEGLSKSRQVELIKSLQDYQPLYSGVASSGAALTVSDESALYRRNEYCDAEQYSRDQYCLERRYMNDGNYIVRIGFKRDEKIPVQPRTYHIKGSDPYQRDTTARDAFLAEWSDRISIEYIGSNYQSFRAVNVVGSHHRTVVMNIEVSEASELTRVLTDPRIIYIEHVGSPRQPLEEITN